MKLFVEKLKSFQDKILYSIDFLEKSTNSSIFVGPAMTRNLIRQGIQDCLEPLVSDSQDLFFTDEDIRAYVKGLPKGFCLGTHADYLFNFATQHFLYIEPSFKDICGFEVAEFLHAAIPETFSKILHPEQGLITTRVHQACYQTLFDEFAGRLDVQVNMDYAIITKNGESRRLLSQFNPLIWKGKSLVLVGGRFTDISHLRKDGQPIVNISVDGKILRAFEPFTQDLVKEKLTEYTIRELEILKATSNGASTEEISAELGVSKATIYAHRRNILAKSEFRSIPKLIESLRFRGILSCFLLLALGI